MRFYVKCDVCNKEFHCEQMRLPKEITLIDGLDMCNKCNKEYHKRLRKMLNGLQKEKFNTEGEQ